MNLGKLLLLWGCLSPLHLERPVGCNACQSHRDAGGCPGPALAPPRALPTMPSCSSGDPQSPLQHKQRLPSGSHTTPPPFCLGFSEVTARSPLGILCTAMKSRGATAHLRQHSPHRRQSHWINASPTNHILGWAIPIAIPQILKCPKDKLSTVLCSREKEGAYTLCNSMDGTGEHYAK